jgi:hypothetical protein
LVRRRPVMKPPSADDSHWTTIRPMPALIVKVVADAPAFGHADTEVRPKPAPSDVSNDRKGNSALGRGKSAPLGVGRGLS